MPLSTTAPASWLLNPSIRVYSSPKPTQPDSSTIGEASCRPQNRSSRGFSTGLATVFMAHIMSLRGAAARIPPRSPAAAAIVQTALTAMFHIVLFRPEIPPNTGNIIRLSANAGCTLHLVRPLGFELERKDVRRAGLDYADLATVRIHPDLGTCLEALAGARVFAIETGGTRCYSDARFEAGDALLFGSEHRGLPATVLERIPVEQQLSIPMRPANRSLNLSNAVALVVYEAWRQQGFTGLADPAM